MVFGIMTLSGKSDGEGHATKAPGWIDIRDFFAFHGQHAQHLGHQDNFTVTAYAKIE